MEGAESSANCVSQAAGAGTQETSMYDATNLQKLSAFNGGTMARFQAFDKAALNAGATEQ